MEPKKAAVIGGVIVAVSVGVFALMQRTNKASAPEPAPVSAPASPAPVEPAPVAQAPEAPLALPDLDASDAFVRGRAPNLFSKALPAPWLQADGLLRRLVAASAIVAEGDSPRDSLSFLKPRGKFKVKKAGGQTYVDPASYARYDALGDAFAALDAQAAAKLIRQLRPLLQQACAELNDSSCDFSQAVIKSTRHLLKTPIVSGDLAVKEKVVSWALVDPDLEKLSAAQKHLLRMGPHNARKILDALRRLSLALGAAEPSLPMPRLYKPAE